jgi:hypothetical protein
MDRSSLSLPNQATAALSRPDGSASTTISPQGTRHGSHLLGLCRRLPTAAASSAKVLAYDPHVGRQTTHHAAIAVDSASLAIAVCFCDVIVLPLLHLCGFVRGGFCSCASSARALLRHRRRVPPNAETHPRGWQGRCHSHCRRRSSNSFSGGSRSSSRSSSGSCWTGLDTQPGRDSTAHL